MAKSLKDTLKLGPKMEFKKTDKNIEATEIAVAQLHEPEIAVIEKPVAEEIIVEKVVEKPVAKLIEVVVEPTPTIADAEITKRVTLDIGLSLHAEIKMKTFRKGITIKEYLLDLARKDLFGA
jgi:hypothetical protein